MGGREVGGGVMEGGGGGRERRGEGGGRVMQPRRMTEREKKGAHLSLARGALELGPELLELLGLDLHLLLQRAKVLLELQVGLLLLRQLAGHARLLLLPVAQLRLGLAQRRLLLLRLGQRLAALDELLLHHLELVVQLRDGGEGGGGEGGRGRGRRGEGREGGGGR